MHACMHALVGVGVVVLLCAHERTFHASRQSGRIVVVQWKSLTKPPCDSVSFSYFSLLPCSSPCTVSVPAPPFSPSPMFSAKHFAPYHPRAHETSSHSLLLQGFGEDLGLDTRRLVRCVHLNTQTHTSIHKRRRTKHSFIPNTRTRNQLIPQRTLQPKFIFSWKHLQVSLQTAPPRRPLAPPRIRRPPSAPPPPLGRPSSPCSSGPATLRPQVCPVQENIWCPWACPVAPISIWLVLPSSRAGRCRRCQRCCGE